MVLLTFCISLSGDIPEPYKSIKNLPFDDHGWFVNSKQLQTLIEDYQPEIVIEVGSWLGASTRFIASHLQSSGLLYAVDTWAGSPNEPAYYIKDSRLPYLYQLFLSNVKHAGLTNKIIPVRMDSIEAANALDVQADLIYIDAAHDTTSVFNDILAWTPHLKQDGIMCGDDWSWKSVQIAVIQAAEILNCEVVSSGNFWMFKPITP
ncbi:MAG: class I SAM-dependent methyltransferase [Parachlamydiaceae bacterium]